jgi:syntaxin 5
MERTGEFFTVVDVLRRHAGVAPSPLAQLASARAPAPGTSPLHRASRVVGRGLRGVERRVARLSHLAQRRGLFDDPAAEINDLTLAVKGELKALGAQLTSLAAEAARLPAGSASAAFWGSEGGGGGGGGVVDVLRARLLDATRTFQGALRIRTDNIREQATARKQFAHSRWAPSAAALPLDSPLFGPGAAAAAAPPPPAPDAAAAGAAAASAALSPLGAATSSPRASANGVGSSGPAAAAPGVVAAGLRRRGGPVPTAGGGGGGLHSAYTPPLPPPPVPSLPQYAGPSRPPLGFLGAGASGGTYSAQHLASMHDARAREADARQVESTIVELGTMFSQMAALVAEQGDVLARIDADVDVTSSNVLKAQGELGKLYERVSTHRGFILRLFGVLALIIVLFGVFKPGR